MNEDRRVPSNADIMVEIAEIKKDVHFTRKDIKRIADNNVNQWDTIRGNRDDLTKMKGAGMAVALILTILSVVGIYLGVFY